MWLKLLKREAKLKLVVAEEGDPSADVFLVSDPAAERKDSSSEEASASPGETNCIPAIAQINNFWAVLQHEFETKGQIVA